MPQSRISALHSPFVGYILSTLASESPQTKAGMQKGIRLHSKGSHRLPKNTLIPNIKVSFLQIPGCVANLAAEQTSNKEACSVFLKDKAETVGIASVSAFSLICAGKAFSGKVNSGNVVQLFKFAILHKTPPWSIADRPFL